MRRFLYISVLLAWLLAQGAHWDLAQSFAWGRMIAGYSRHMPVAEAVRLTFTADNLCGICEFVADGKTRAEAGPSPSPGLPFPAYAKAKPPLALPPAHPLVFSSTPAPCWPSEHFRPESVARPAPPIEPPRSA